MTDLANTKEQKQIIKLIFARQVVGRPYIAPPGLPPDRLAALRQAFIDTLSDKDFLTDAERSKLEISPVPGDKVEALVKEVYETPAEVATKTGVLLIPK